ncbi:MAG: type II toxin-antitoxin system prevent-host-death family antitoxin [Thermodesulfobacteriota bacterium]|nr:type II toxin-antitoxin system prevent-host-death family antitoxin [Thermodesulfobacteriota bacterium]
MKTATVGQIQKNFAKILRNISNGEEITITKRGQPIARISSLGPKDIIDWPDFYGQAIKLKGKSVSKLVTEGREDRF